MEKENQKQLNDYDSISDASDESDNQIFTCLHKKFKKKHDQTSDEDEPHVESAKALPRKSLITSNDQNADEEGNYYNENASCAERISPKVTPRKSLTNEEIINRDGEEENRDVEAIVGDSMCRKVDENNIVFREFMQCMQEEKCHKNNDINDNVSVAMMTPNRNFFTDNKPRLSNAALMMDQIIELNPHMDLKREMIPASMALEFFRFLWEKSVSVMNSLIMLQMIDCVNDFLRSMQGAPAGNQINNETQLREWFFFD